MIYLLTGGTGFLGSHILRYLQATGNEVFVATRNPKGDGQILADFEKGLLDLDRLKSRTGTDKEYMVIHGAGKAHIVPKSDVDKKAFFDVNVEGTRMLLREIETLPALPKGFVFVSSVSVYGRETGELIGESEPLNAKDAYGQSKIEAEKLVLDWGQKHGIVVGIARLPLVAGANPPGNLGAMIKGIRSGKYFRLGKGDARKSMVMASDVAAILPAIAEIGGIFNLTDGIHPSFAELEDGIASALHMKPVKRLPMAVALLAGAVGSFAEKITTKKMPINRLTVRKIVSPLTFLDQKARETLGWAPVSVLGQIKQIVS